MRTSSGCFLDINFLDSIKQSYKNNNNNKETSRRLSAAGFGDSSLKITEGCRHRRRVLYLAKKSGGWWGWGAYSTLHPMEKQ